MHTGLITQVSPLHNLPTRQAARGRRLNPQQALDLRDEYTAGVSLAVLAAKYGVSKQTVHRITTGKAYAELASLSNPRARTPWVDPVVRRRGGCEDDEIRPLVSMLRAYPGRKALLKQTKLEPHFTPCTIPGVMLTVERNSAGYGVYVQWAGEHRATA